MSLTKSWRDKTLFVHHFTKCTAWSNGGESVWHRLHPSLESMVIRQSHWPDIGQHWSLINPFNHNDQVAIGWTVSSINYKLQHAQQSALILVTIKTRGGPIAVIWKLYPVVTATCFLLPVPITLADNGPSGFLWVFAIFDSAVAS